MEHLDRLEGVPDQLEEIFLRRPRRAYLISAGSIIITSLVIIMVMFIFDISYDNNRVSPLLQTLATVQLTTLTIIFSLTVAGIQFATRQLPPQVSRVYFRTPIFKLTIIGLAGGAILELATDAVLPLIGTTLGLIWRLFWLSTIISIGLYSILLLVIYILTFPDLMSVKSLLEYFEERAETEDGVTAILTVFNNSIRDKDVQKGEAANEALLGLVKRFVGEGVDRPIGMTSQHLVQLLEYQIPQIAENIEQRSVFHGMVTESYRSAIELGTIHGSLSVLHTSRRGLEKICSSSNIAEQDEFGYWSSVNEASKRLESKTTTDTPIDVLVSVPSLQYDLFKRTELAKTSAYWFNQCSSFLMDTYLNIYRALVFNFEDQGIPALDVQQDSWSNGVEQPPMENIQNSLTESLELIYLGISEFDSDEIKTNVIAPPFGSICTIVFTQWGRKSAIPMLSLYFETAYLYSGLPHFDKNQWRGPYESFLRGRDINPNNPLDIIGWYEDQGFELQQLSFESTARVEQEYEDWLCDFLDCE